MGTGKKLYTRDNGFPGPNQYKIKGFADLVKTKGDKINETRIMLKEKKKQKTQKNKEWLNLEKKDLQKKEKI